MCFEKYALNLIHLPSSVSSVYDRKQIWTITSLKKVSCKLFLFYLVVLTNFAFHTNTLCAHTEGTNSCPLSSLLPLFYEALKKFHLNFCSINLVMMRVIAKGWNKMRYSVYKQQRDKILKTQYLSHGLKTPLFNFSDCNFLWKLY